MIDIVPAIVPARRGRPRGSFRPHPPGERDYVMKYLSNEGKTLQEIGDRFGITRERVRQLLTKHFGITEKNSARYKNSTAIKIERRILRQEELAQRKEQRYSKMFGCSVDALIQINGGPFIRSYGDNSCPASKYYSQKASATKRGIGWNISFPDWWRIWEESGKYRLRGPGKGYCMARLGDSGAYEVGNVYICTIGQNFSDSYIVRPKRPQKSHCKWGHERTEDNLYANGGCKTCGRIKPARQKREIEITQLQATA